MYEYPAQLVEVIDGDTVDVKVDLGFHIHRTVRLRLAGVDTAEIFGVDHSSEQYQSGMEHASFVEDWFADAVDTDQEASAESNETWPLIVRTEKKGKYGRYIATVERAHDGEEITEQLASTFPSVAK